MLLRNLPIPHRLLSDGFLAALSQPELLLYIFLILAADRYGLSYYSDDRFVLNRCSGILPSD
jgi:hypothetical protein